MDGLPHAGKILQKLLVYLNRQSPIKPEEKGNEHMPAPSDVICPNCKKSLISFHSGSKEGLSRMVVEADALAHKEGILCKACRTGTSFLLDLDRNNRKARFTPLKGR
jgi:hypothetical protein